ncbi:ester cyclase [Neolewinella litorea]|uniref:Ester cyclase n=1 Tax=Neolewinella litorea TaxID=2562452 RepID=A0A4S4NEF5_9BACT|nr:ester cyclase [Neolewinella litorea]THH36488.1 ester cyclase [Neolewinella litorea]
MTNLEVQKQFGEAVNTGQLEKIRDLVAQDVKDHDPAPMQGPGPQGFIDFFSMMRSAFPDLHIEVKHVVTDADNVTFAYTVSGTHQGEFMGLAPTGKQFSARGVQIGRFENGKLKERWGSSDELGILKQLGAERIPQ